MSSRQMPHSGRGGPEFRATKRRRLSPAEPLAPFSNRQAQFQSSAPLRPKRSRSGVLRGRGLTRAAAPRKRRRSMPHSNGTPEPARSAKRLRPTLDDVEMADVSNQGGRGGGAAPRRRKTLLRDVLRAEKVSRAMWQSVLVQRGGASSSIRDSTSTAAAPSVRNAEPSARSEMGPRRASVESVTRLTGDEEVCEVIDASENTDPNIEYGAGYFHSTESSRPGTEPSVQAVLLEDGMCAVRIVRADGSTQSVIIQPPDADEDGGYGW